MNWQLHHTELMSHLYKYINELHLSHCLRILYDFVTLWSIAPKALYQLNHDMFTILSTLSFSRPQTLHKLTSRFPLPMEYVWFTLGDICLSGHSLLLWIVNDCEMDTLYILKKTLKWIPTKVYEQTGLVLQLRQLLVSSCWVCCKPVKRNIWASKLTWIAYILSHTCAHLCAQDQNIYMCKCYERIHLFWPC